MPLKLLGMNCVKDGRKPEYPDKTPGDELQKMPSKAELNAISTLSNLTAELSLRTAWYTTRRA